MFCGVMLLAGQSKVVVGVGTITNYCTTDNDSAVMVDTFPIAPMLGSQTWKTVVGSVTLSASANTKRGYGLDDSGWIWLYTTWGCTTLLVDSAVAEGLPMTLSVAHAASTAGADTLWKENMWVAVMLYDSTGDTNMTAAHDVDYKFILKE